MTILAVVVVAVASLGFFAYVIVRLLADNRRLTAALVAPHPEQQARIVADRPVVKRAEPEERTLRQVGV